MQSPHLQAELKGCLEHPQAVGHAAAEIDGRGILEIPGGAGQLPDAITEPDDLGQHLVVEDKVV